MLILVLAGVGLGAGAAPAAVAGGTMAQECEWPTVVTYRVGDDKCTGTLVHPEVMVTAAHCMEEGMPGAVRAGEDFSPHEIRFDIDECFANSEYWETRSPSDDFAVCRLLEPATGVPIVPIAMGCEGDAVVPGAEVVVVGFGQTPDDFAFGFKRWAQTKVLDTSHPGALIQLGDEEVNGCLGDSGGPAFVQMPDGQWRAFGILTAGEPCGEGPSWYTRIDSNVAWLETQAGIDITPCHDVDGNPDPGNGCRDFAADPTHATTWDEDCVAPLVDPSGECPPALENDDEGGSSGGDGDDDDDAGEADDDDDAGQADAGDDEADRNDEASGCRAIPEPPLATLLLLFAAWRRRASVPAA